jgi:hypothetical protein
MKESKKKVSKNLICNHPEIRDSFKNQRCPEEQIIKCHGYDMLDKLKKKGM